MYTQVEFMPDIDPFLQLAILQALLPLIVNGLTLEQLRGEELSPLADTPEKLAELRANYLELDEEHHRCIAWAHEQGSIVREEYDKHVSARFN